MEMKYPHFIDLNDYPVEWWNKLIKLGAEIYAHPQRYVQACAGKIMATLFVSLRPAPTHAGLSAASPSKVAFRPDRSV